MPKRSPLIRSGVVLRAIATAATFSSLASMTAFAATHVQNSAAPLQPTSPDTSTAATAAATPAPTTRTTTRSTTLTGRVATTTTTTRTKTHSS